MTFDMEKLIKRPLIDDQAFYVEKVSEDEIDRQYETDDDRPKTPTIDRQP